METSETKKKRKLIEKIKKLVSCIQSLKGRGEFIENIHLINLNDKEIDELIAIINKLLDLFVKLVNHSQTEHPTNPSVSKAESPSNNQECGGKKSRRK
jgi:hypothetical protein